MHQDAAVSCRYGLLNIPSHTLDSWYNLRKLFQTACMDFLVLQSLKFDKVIRCICAHPQLARLMVDGLSLGIALRRLNTTTPWGPEAGTPSSSGSLFTARVGIADSRLRSAVLEFASGGMSEAKHRQLLTNIRRLDRMRCDLEHALLPFLDMTCVEGPLVVPQPCARWV